MSDVEKPDWQEYWDEQVWTQETVEQLFLGFLHEIRAPLAGLDASIKILSMNPRTVEPLLALSDHRLKNLNALLYETIDYIKKRIDDNTKTNS